MICTYHQILLRWSGKDEWGGWGMRYVWGRAEVHTGFLVGRPGVKRPLGRPRISWYDNIGCGVRGHGLD